MNIAQTRTQRVVFVNRETKRAIYPITFVGVGRQIRIVRFKVIVENTPAKANTIYGEVRVSDGEFGIGLVIVLGSLRRFQYRSRHRS